MDPQSLDEGTVLDTQFSAAELASSSVFPGQRTKVTAEPAEPWEFPLGPALGPELAAQAAPETGVWALQPPHQARRLGTPKSIDDIPDELFIVIAADGGLSLRDFGRLACVASRFWARSVVNHTDKNELWSVMEAAAQRRLHSLHIQDWVPRTKEQPSWMRLLREAEVLLKPLRFTQTGEGLHAIDEGTTIVCGPESPGGVWRSACCDDHVMRAGVHYAEFEVNEPPDQNTPVIGVVGANFSPASNGQASDHAACGMYWRAQFGSAGEMFATGTVSEHYQPGDVVGLLLDMTAGSLVLYLNGERKAMIVGGDVDVAGSRITGPVKWAVDQPTPEADQVADRGYSFHSIHDDASSIRIATRPVPAPPTAEVLAAEAAWEAAAARDSHRIDIDMMHEHQLTLCGDNQNVCDDGRNGHTSGPD